MALKKSQLYSSLWHSCDELRGGMDASQYKDYVLTLLFMKYVSDRHAGRPDALIDVPAGGGFADIAALKGCKDIGERINTIIATFARANGLQDVIDQADFDDDSKLGSGKEMQAGCRRWSPSSRASISGRTGRGATTCSGWAFRRNRSPIPAETDHPFRRKPITCRSEAARDLESRVPVLSVLVAGRGYCMDSPFMSSLVGSVNGH